MNHDISTGLVHFTDYELGLIAEQRSPIDYRAMPVMAPVIRKMAAACADELRTLIDDNEDDSRGNRRIAITKLMKKSEDLESLAIGTGIIAAQVELEVILQT